MSSWDTAIFAEEPVVDFLEELADRDEEDIEEGVLDACSIAATDTASDDDVIVGQAAATIAAIWNGAPFSVGQVADNFPFLREQIGTTSEELREAATAVLEAVDPTGLEDEDDLDVFIEALS